MSDEKRFAPKCIWCSAPWSDDNVRAENFYASQGCDTCGFGGSEECDLVISCHECGKEMYRKEVSNQH